MGKRGPPPKPSRQKELEGTYRADRAVRNEMTPTLGAPPCPKSLTGEALAEWKRVVPELVRLGVLAVIDGSRLADYCRAHALAIKAAVRAEAEGEVIDTYKGPTRSPWHAVAHEARAQARMLGSEFGLTPSARSRVSGAEKDERPDAAESDLFGKPLEVVNGGKP
jgi:P27 family predicted phage terminase small subunit